MGVVKKKKKGKWHRAGRELSSPRLSRSSRLSGVTNDSLLLFSLPSLDVGSKFPS